MNWSPAQRQYNQLTFQVTDVEPPKRNDISRKTIYSVDRLFSVIKYALEGSINKFKRIGFSKILFQQGRKQVDFDGACIKLNLFILKRVMAQLIEVAKRQRSRQPKILNGLQLSFGAKKVEVRVGHQRLTRQAQGVRVKRVRLNTHRQSLQKYKLLSDTLREKQYYRRSKQKERCVRSKSKQQTRYNYTGFFERRLLQGASLNRSKVVVEKR